MSDETTAPIVVAIEIGDGALRDRLAALLGAVAGLRLATPGEAASVAIVARDPRDRIEPSETDLTPRRAACATASVRPVASSLSRIEPT